MSSTVLAHIFGDLVQLIGSNGLNQVSQTFAT